MATKRPDAAAQAVEPELDDRLAAEILADAAQIGRWDAPTEREILLSFVESLARNRDFFSFLASMLDDRTQLPNEATVVRDDTGAVIARVERRDVTFLLARKYGVQRITVRPREGETGTATVLYGNNFTAQTFFVSFLDAIDWAIERSLTSRTNFTGCQVEIL